MTSTGIEDSPTLAAACERFLGEIGDWVSACVEELSGAAAVDGHDQGTFTTGWAPYVRARNDRAALGFMTGLRDRIRDRFVSTGTWKHGYWRMADVHHGTEHFELFVGALWGLRPDDPATVEQLVDAAEHMGNWVPEIPAWFDWDAGLFRGLHFGTDGLTSFACLERPPCLPETSLSADGPTGKPRVAVPQPEGGADFNLPDHFRCANVCLLAHAMTGEQRYLDLASLYGGRWADAILSGDELPVGLNKDGAVYFLSADEEGAYRGFAGQLGKLRLSRLSASPAGDELVTGRPDGQAESGGATRLRAAVDRAENFLASGAVGALLKLWELTGEVRFRAASERLLDVIATQVTDPDAGTAADALRAYRRATDDDRYDGRVLKAVGQLSPFDFSELSIAQVPQRQERPSGIGKRKDAPDWYEDGSPRRHNPILLAAAAELKGDERLAARAVDIARAYFRLARQVYPHGREHGCSARSVSAIARGHGRENNAGMVTAVLEPVMRAFPHPRPLSHGARGEG